MTRFMSRAEVEGIVCSGECRGRQHTYALLDERVPPTPELTKEEALARLATAYFRSHAPAYPARLLLVARFAFNGSKASHFSDRTGTDVRTMAQPDMVHP